MNDKYNITKDQNIFLAKTWKPEIPDENKIIEDFKNFNKIKCITERAITIMCYLMRTQFFTDGNKRTAMLFANKIMIQNGIGEMENTILSPFLVTIIVVIHV